MSGGNKQRKPGTTRGSPRRSRTAKASRISRFAVKSRCAHEWDGWGRLSDDGPGHYNPNPSEDPLGGGVITLQGGAQSSARPDTVRDNRCDSEVHEGRQKRASQEPRAVKPLVGYGTFGNDEPIRAGRRCASFQPLPTKNSRATPVWKVEGLPGPLFQLPTGGGLGGSVCEHPLGFDWKVGSRGIPGQSVGGWKSVGQLEA